MLSRAYRKDSIPQQGRETAALRDFKPASAETRVGARPVPPRRPSKIEWSVFPGLVEPSSPNSRGVTKPRTAAALH